MKSRQEAEKYLENNGFKNCEILDHFTGESNHNYIFRSGEEKLVLRSNLEDKESTYRLDQERKILKFLEKQEIDFVPRSIKLDENREIHITSYTGNTDISVEDMEIPLLEQWVEKLVKIHEIDYEDFKQFCIENGYEYNKPETIKKTIQKYGFERLEYAEENVDHELLGWCREKLENIDRNIEDENQRRIGLSHGDIANNTRKEDPEIYFIDWELARFTQNPENMLSYLYIHEELSQEKYETIKQIYQDIAGISGFDESLERSEKLTRVNDVIWALRRAAKLQDKENADEEEYIQLAEKRKQKFEARFREKP